MTISNSELHKIQPTRSTEIEAERLHATKAAYTTRRINRNAIKTLLEGDLKPSSGVGAGRKSRSP